MIDTTDQAQLDKLRELFELVKDQKIAVDEATRIILQDNIKQTTNNRLHESLYDLTNIFIQLFFRTHQKYSCSRTKLCKLLSILAFKYAIQGLLLFDEPIQKYPPDCGTLIKDLTFVCRDVYVKPLVEEYYDQVIKITEVLDYTVKIDRPYETTRSIRLPLLKEVEDVFREFGAYPVDVLGKLLTPIADKIVKDNSDELDLLILQNFNRNDFDVNNAIADYLFK